MTIAPANGKLPARPRGWIVATALLLSGAPAGRAALWDSDHWALTAGIGAGAGYDNNLFARAGGAGDSYLLVTPSLAIRRLNSLTNLEADFSVRSYTFLNRSDLNTLDPSLAVQFRFPSDDESLATEEVAAQVSRSTEGNNEVGGRLRRDDFDARWDARFNPTGQVTVRPRAEISRTNYLTAGFNTNDNASAGLTVAVSPNERLELGAAYDFAYSRTQPDDGTLPETFGRHHQFTVRGHGEFLSKVSGDIAVGASDDLYRGAFRRSAWDLVANLILAWQATARTQVALKADRTTYFSASGSALTHSGLGLEWSQELIAGLTATVGADVAVVNYSFGSSYRRDHQEGVHVLLHYALTERWSATFSTTYYRQRSDALFDIYNHSVTYAGVSAKF